MIARISTIAFQGIKRIPVEVQVMVSPGRVGIQIVGLPDKAVIESRERIQSALYSCGLALPAKRVTINLAPADLPKEGSHYDLPIILALMASIQAINRESLSRYLAVGEINLDGSLAAINGALPAAICAKNLNKDLICPKVCGSEAAWASDSLNIIAPSNILELTNHLNNKQQLSRPFKSEYKNRTNLANFSDIKGQKTIKRALEIAAAGGHNLLMIGPPGAGKSMLASCLPSILPPLSLKESLEVSMIYSLSRKSSDASSFIQDRPFRTPHHSVTTAALIGGGTQVLPGEASLAHNGILFLDELPEFSPHTLNSLRQPLETGECIISRANRKISYPARIQLIAAMNPCRCGMSSRDENVCIRGPRCAIEYQSRISGPLMDRIDIRIAVPAVPAADLFSSTKSEPSEIIASRVLLARKKQKDRLERIGSLLTHNAVCSPALIEKIAILDLESTVLLNQYAEKMLFSARGYHKILKIARTIADLDSSEKIKKIHIAEAIAYRKSSQFSISNQ
ncbi:AAA family ATPase [Candidatus Liberibacter solanacearum]|uniref:Mg(2+) chelatase family protein n=1 Tax=Candidatus Liberibacter solanacearum TaxID=556287 RepID=A0A0F4VIH3_9HYPH|nr:YifB family Mg chelatase-like AAA ATPase [Candidatus Liberibacter solanacearum]KJZ81236.1 ATPase AAA [Candidatus Liberibacter solanacearum]KJZ81720.1 Mg(2+) chelatase family protein [Candidatus Liberibacter solanacearum]KQC48976.1 AAA family ATPase [Candidatus Liberibacter solanacearum]